MSFNNETDTMLNIISVYFECKSCEFTFPCQTVDEFLAHKKQEHFGEFQKIRCIVFEEKKNDAMLFTTDENEETETETKLFAQDDGVGDVDELCSGSDISEIFKEISEQSTLKPLSMLTQVLQPVNLSNNKTASKTMEAAALQEENPRQSHELNAEFRLFSAQIPSLNYLNHPYYDLDTDLNRSNYAHTEGEPHRKNIHMVVENNPTVNNISPIHRFKNPYVLLRRLTSKEILSSNCSSNRKSKLNTTSTLKILHSTSTKKVMRGTVLCPICSKSYDTKRILSSHMKIHYGFVSGPRLNKCPYPNCSSSFRTKVGLKSHKKRHENAISNPKRNTYVNKPQFIFPKPDNDIGRNHSDTFTLKEWLVNQKSLEHSNSSETVNIIRLDPDPTAETEEKVGVKISAANPIKCKFCIKNLESEAEVKVHVMHCWLQNKRKHRYCLPCNKTLSTPPMLRIHNASVHNPLGRKRNTKPKVNQVKPEHQCPLCPMKAKKASRLKKHMETHKPDEERSRPFVCEICGLASHNRDNFNRHRLIHGEERTFKCSHPNCAAAFKTSQARNSHLNSHAVSKLFACPKEGCSHRFKSKSGLSYHLKSTCHLSHGGPQTQALEM